MQDYIFAVGQVAQSSLRSIIGKSDLDDLLSDRERLHEGLALMIDSPAAGIGVCTSTGSRSRTCSCRSR